MNSFVKSHLFGFCDAEWFWHLIGHCELVQMVWSGPDLREVHNFLTPWVEPHIEPNPNSNPNLLYLVIFSSFNFLLESRHPYNKTVWQLERKTFCAAALGCGETKQDSQVIWIWLCPLKIGQHFKCVWTFCQFSITQNYPKHYYCNT